MRVTNNRLRRIIREQLVVLLEQAGKSPEYDRGYDDGLGGKPVADDANDDYNEGYEDGEMDAEADETES